MGTQQPKASQSKGTPSCLCGHAFISVYILLSYLRNNVRTHEFETFLQKVAQIFWLLLLFCRNQFLGEGYACRNLTATN